MAYYSGALAPNLPISTPDEAYSWMLLRYPLSKSIRAKLVKLYFELCLVPGIDARTIRSWADMLSRILGKSSVKPKLSPEDLQLPWKPLWLCLKKEIWPQERTQDPKYVGWFICMQGGNHRYTVGILSTYCCTSPRNAMHTMIPMRSLRCLRSSSRASRLRQVERGVDLNLAVFN